MDTITLTVTIEQADPPQTDPANTLPIYFDIAFQKRLIPPTFGIGDLTQNGTATGITWSITNSGDAINFALSAAL